MEKILDRAKLFFENNTAFVLFLFFFSVYLFLGFYLFLPSSNFISKGYDIIFDADCPRVIKDLIQMDVFRHDYHRLHPLFKLMFRPLFFIFGLFSKDVFLNFTIIQSAVGSGACAFLNLTLCNFTSNKELSFLLTAIFGFSFSTLIFAAFPETYIFTAFFIALFLYLVSCVVRDDVKTLSVPEIAAFSFLMIFIFGINISNIILPLILLPCLFLKIFGRREAFLKILICLGFFLVAYFLFMNFEKNIWNISYLQNVVRDNGFVNDKYYSFGDFSLLKAGSMFAQNFIAPLTALPAAFEINIHGFPTITFAKAFNPLWLISVLILYLFALKNILSLKNNKNYAFFWLFFIFLVLNGLFFMVYGKKDFFGNSMTFLFSQNYLGVLVLFLGMLFALKEDKFTKYFLRVFLGLQMAFNTYFVLNLKLFLASFQNLPVRSIFVILALFMIFVLLVKISAKFLPDGFKKASVHKKCFCIVCAYLFFVLIYGCLAALFPGEF